MKKLFGSLSGNSRLKLTLARDTMSGRLSHAYILEGSDGSGRHTAVLLTAAAMSCEHRDDTDSPLPCMTCTACRKVLDGYCPDIVYVRRGDEASIGVDVIREMKKTLAYPPHELERVIYIIEEGDLLTTEAQNALLLSIEDPPAHVMFFILVNNKHSLLETILSRAPVIPMQRFTPDALSGMVRKTPDGSRLYSSDNARFNEIMTCAGASFGKALKLIRDTSGETDKLLETRHSAVSLIEAVIMPDSAEAADIALTLPSSSTAADRRKCTDIILYAQYALRDLLAVKNGSPSLCFFSSAEDAQKLASRFSVKKISLLYDRLCELSDELERSLSPAAAFASLIFSEKY